MKQVIIMIGVSGSGKSTKAREYCSEYPALSSVICSADDFFLDNEGNYNFDASKLGRAHDACFKKFQDALKNDIDVIVVDNTNLLVSSIRPYVEAANAYGDCQIKFSFHRCPANVAAQRNAHRVPLKTIEKMVDRYNTLLENFPEEWMTFRYGLSFFDENGEREWAI